jgi:hypothetical protein
MTYWALASGAPLLPPEAAIGAARRRLRASVPADIVPEQEHQGRDHEQAKGQEQQTFQQGHETAPPEQSGSAPKHKRRALTGAKS